MERFQEIVKDQMFLLLPFPLHRLQLEKRKIIKRQMQTIPGRFAPIPKLIYYILLIFLAHRFEESTLGTTLISVLEVLVLLQRFGMASKF